MKVLVFAGAGASTAVNSKQYPTTAAFFRDVRTKIRNVPLFDQVVSYLQSSRSGDDVDIELVLWALTELRDFCALASDTKSVAGWFLHGNRLGGVVGVQADTQNMRAMSAQSIAHVDALSSQINAYVYDLYGGEPSKDELAENWLLLLGALCKAGHQVNVCTTNYDGVIEKAIEYGSLPIRTGQSTGYRARLDEHLWDLKVVAAEGPNSAGRLTKLHGSVDWTRGPSCIYTGNPVFEGAHDKRVIIYPGFKGVPTQEPFLRFHACFQHQLAEADMAIFVGYAFRDDYINTIVGDGLRSNIPIFIVNPEKKLPKMPFSGRDIEHITQGFDKESVYKFMGSFS